MLEQINIFSENIKHIWASKAIQNQTNAVHYKVLAVLLIYYASQSGFVISWSHSHITRSLPKEKFMAVKGERPQFSRLTADSSLTIPAVQSI